MQPLYQVFQFVTPPAGTGKITFRTLIKSGPANAGAFWYANVEDLSLSEGEAVEPSFLTTSLGQSCEEFCNEGKLGRCDSNAMANLNTTYTKLIASSTCLLPAISTCRSPGLTTGVDNMCYQGDVCGATAADDYCKAKSTNEEDGKRMCICNQKLFLSIGGLNLTSSEAGGIMVGIGLVAVGAAVGFKVVRNRRKAGKNGNDGTLQLTSKV
jgi:hypothetical protein